MVFTPECLVQRVPLGSTFALWDSQKGSNHVATCPPARQRVTARAKGSVARPGLVAGNGDNGGAEPSGRRVGRE